MAKHDEIYQASGTESHASESRAEHDYGASRASDTTDYDDHGAREATTDHNDHGASGASANKEGEGDGGKRREDDGSKDVPP